MGLMLFHEKVFYFQRMKKKTLAYSRKFHLQENKYNISFNLSMDIILFNVTLKKAMVEINAIRTVLLWQIMKSICNKSEVYHGQGHNRASKYSCQEGRNLVKTKVLMRTYRLPWKQNTKVFNEMFVIWATKYHDHSVVVFTRYLKEIQRFHKD